MISKLAGSYILVFIFLSNGIRYCQGISSQVNTTSCNLLFRIEFKFYGCMMRDNIDSSNKNGWPPGRKRLVWSSRESWLSWCCCWLHMRGHGRSDKNRFQNLGQQRFFNCRVFVHDRIICAKDCQCQSPLTDSYSNVGLFLLTEFPFFVVLIRQMCQTESHDDVIFRQYEQHTSCTRWGRANRRWRATQVESSYFFSAWYNEKLLLLQNTMLHHMKNS